MIRLSKDGGKTVILQCFEALQVSPEPAVDPHYAMVVDTETTGKGPSDQIIEFCARAFEFCAKTGRVTALFDIVHGLQDPCRPLDPVITQITGLSDADLQGKSIDWAVVVEGMQAVEFIIAFNAEFDRGMVDAELRQFQGGAALADQMVWGCALKQIDWSAVRRTALAQDVLCAHHGFVYPPHRASIDVDACVHLLQVSGKLPELFKRATAEGFLILATGLPRQQKDIVKERGYKWDGQVWSKEFADVDDARAELQWLKPLCPRAMSQAVAPWDRFKK